jgi:serine/threonine protein kinase/tetratricopeptide (TPR) repeat protein
MTSDESTLPGTPPGAGATRGRPRVEPGARIGRYVIIDELGRGGMGVVYAAYDPELDRKVAVKLLHDAPSGSTLPMAHALGKVMNALFGDAPDEVEPPAPELSPAQQRLLREAQAVARINDPAVVTVHDVGQWQGRIFIAMEFVQGRTLRAWAAARTRSWREVVDVMCKAGSGLVAAHACGLVHRDFKPDNVMVGDDGRVRVMDFGLVRSDGSAESDTIAQDLRPNTDALALELTSGGVAVGTPAYMSPEQHLGRPLDAASDQFSFCVALWEALYGVRPFVGDSVASLATAVIEGARVDPPDGRGVPASLKQVVARGLAREPAERWPSMSALVAELRRDPLRRRNRIVAAAGIASITAVIAGGVHLDRRAAQAGCREDAQAVDASWNDEIRTRIADQITQTGASYAATSTRTIVRWIDEYATSWASLTESVCLATLDGPAAEYPADARACLDERRAELDGIVASLSQVDASSVRHLASLTSTVTMPEDCIDDAAAAARALQASTRPAADMAEARGRIAAARRSSTLGRFDDARVELEAVIEADADPEPTSVTGWARLALGLALERKGDYAEAETALVDAAFAAESVGDGATVVRAASELVWVIGYRSGRPNDVELWTRWGQVLLERLHLEDHLTGADFHESLGMVESARLRYAEANDHLERAVAIKRERLGADHPEVGLALNSLGTVQMHLGGPDAATPLWTEALQILEAALGDSHPDLGVVLSNLAQVAFIRGDFVTARTLIERSIALARAEYGPDHPNVARALGNLGTVLKAAGDLDGAAAALREAITALEHTHGREHRSVATTTVTLGRVEVARGNSAVGIALMEEGLEIQRRVLPPGDGDLAATLAGLASARLDLGDLDAALRLYLESLEVCEASGPEGHPVFTPIALHQIGKVYVLRGETTTAIPYLERALARFVASQPDSNEAAESRFWLGQALWRIGADRARASELVDLARAHFVAAADKVRLAELDAWRAANPRETNAEPQPSR